MNVNRRTQLGTVVATLLILVLGFALLYAARAYSAPAGSSGQPGTASAAAAPTITPSPLPSGTPGAATLLSGICGVVGGGLISDGATMLLTLTTAGSTATQYRLDYQFESGGGAHPLDIDGRVPGTLAWLQGTQAAPATGTPNATTLRGWMLRRASSCAPLALVDVTPSLFTLGQGCAFMGSPVSTADQTDWKVSCGAAADRAARDMLRPALTSQGWTSCGAVTAHESWVRSRFLLGVSEGSGAAGEYPKLTQMIRRTDGCQ